MFKNVLLVDDDEDDREFFIQVIEELEPDVKCVCAKNGHDAFKIMDGFEPDVIFLDLNMPLMNGFQFLEKFRQRNDFKDIPIYILSTSSDPKSIQEANAYGAKNFLTKPDNLSGWKAIVKKVFSLP